VRVQTILKIIGAVILLVFIWLVFNPTSHELRTKQKETLLKKRIGKSVDKVKEIDKEIQRLKRENDY